MANNYKYFTNSNESIHYKQKDEPLAISVCVVPEFVHIREIAIDVMQDADIVECTEAEFMGEYNEALYLLSESIK